MKMIMEPLFVYVAITNLISLLRMGHGKNVMMGIRIQMMDAISVQLEKVGTVLKIFANLFVGMVKLLEVKTVIPVLTQNALQIVLTLSIITIVMEETLIQSLLVTRDTIIDLEQQLLL